MDATSVRHHRRSRENLLAAEPARDFVRLLSSETQITSATPPMFLVATTDDSGVPAENSLLFYQALRSARVAVEMHIYKPAGTAPGWRQTTQCSRLGCSPVPCG